MSRFPGMQKSEENRTRAVEQKFAAKERAGLFGATVRGQHEFSDERKMIGSNPRKR
jgi:hypothetical protein